MSPKKKMDQEDLNFKLGSLMAQVTSLSNQVISLVSTIAGMDARLRENEKMTTALTVKVALIGALGGGGGGTIALLIFKIAGQL